MSFERLYEKGKYQDLLELAETSISNIENKFWKIVALKQLGRFNEAKTLGIEYQENFTSPKWLGRYYTIMADIYRSKGNPSKALEVLNEGLENSEQASDGWNKANIMRIMGIIYMDEGSYQEAMEYYVQSLKMSTKYSNNVGVALALNNMSIIDYKKGNLSACLKLLNESLMVSRKLENANLIGVTLGNIGTLQKTRGDVDDAIKYLEESLIWKSKVGNLHSMAHHQLELAGCLAIKGKFTEAIEYMQKGLEVEKSVGNTILKSEILVGIIRLLGMASQRDEVPKYLSILEELSKEGSSPLFSIDYKLAKGLYLKSSKRLSEKIEAQKLFMKIISNKDADFGRIIESLCYLIELLIHEYKLYKNDEVLQEINIHLTRLYDLSQDQHLFSFLLDALVLRAKLAIVLNDFDTASQMIEQALFTAEEKKLTIHLEQLKLEKIKFEEEILGMRDALKQSSVADRIEKSAIMDYILKAQRHFAEQ